MGKKGFLMTILILAFPAVLLGELVPRPHFWIGLKGGAATYMRGGESDNRPIFGGELIVTIPVLPLDLEVSGDYFRKSEPGGTSTGFIVDFSGRYDVLPAVPIFDLHFGLGGGFHNWGGDVRPLDEEEASYPDFHVLLALSLRFSKVGLFVEPRYSRVFAEDGVNVFSGSGGIMYRLF